MDVNRFQLFAERNGTARPQFIISLYYQCMHHFLGEREYAWAVFTIHVDLHILNFLAWTKLSTKRELFFLVVHQQTVLVRQHHQALWHSYLHWNHLMARLDWLRILARCQFRSPVLPCRITVVSSAYYLRAGLSVARTDKKPELILVFRAFTLTNHVARFALRFSRRVEENV